MRRESASEIFATSPRQKQDEGHVNDENPRRRASKTRQTCRKRDRTDTRMSRAVDCARAVDGGSSANAGSVGDGILHDRIARLIARFLVAVAVFGWLPQAFVCLLIE